MKLSQHFNLDEFTFSETAVREGRTIEVPENILDNIQYLVTTVLEPIRVLYGKPLVISSGYRPAWLNSLVGGSKTSAHMEGLAADVRPVGMSSAVFAKWIQNHLSDLKIPVDQVINEGGRWVHISTRFSAPRAEFLTATFGPEGTVYTKGV